MDTIEASDLFLIRCWDNKYTPSDNDKYADPLIQWQSRYTARFGIGEFVGHVDFYLQAGRRHRGWWPVTVPAGKTGLFPKINTCLRVITEKYLNEVQPVSLFVYGDDAKRNDWNSAHYLQFRVPPTYRFFVIKNPNSFRRNSVGVIGVGWVKNGEKIPQCEFTNDLDRMEFV